MILTAARNFVKFQNYDEDRGYDPNVFGNYKSQSIQDTLLAQTSGSYFFLQKNGSDETKVQMEVIKYVINP